MLRKRGGPEHVIEALPRQPTPAHRWTAGSCDAAAELAAGDCTMASDSNRPRNPPKGYATVTPWIIGGDTAGLIEFLKVAFVAQELARIPNESGGIAHAEVRIGDSVVMMFDARPGWPETPAFMRLYFDDADEVFRRTVRAGATVVTEMTELAFGERVGRVRDPFGNIWWLHTRIADLDEKEMQRRMADETFVEAMRYVETSLDSALRRSD
jgi:PhnB protein